MPKARSDDEMRNFLNAKSEKVTESGCLIWLGGLDKDGYGQTHFKGKNIRTHRLSWMLANGPIPDGLCVMHSCDVPTCINPDHLSLGTNQENTADKMKKNRHKPSSGDEHYLRRRPKTRAGERCPTVKLTEQSVIEILKDLANGKEQKELAVKYGVSRTAISAIATRRNWNHITLNTGATEQ